MIVASYGVEFGAGLGLPLFRCSGWMRLSKSMAAWLAMPGIRCWEVAIVNPGLA